jgi:hypothetical protein
VSASVVTVLSRQLMLLGIAMVLFPLAAVAQQELPVLGFLSSG